MLKYVKIQTTLFPELPYYFPNCHQITRLMWKIIYHIVSPSLPTPLYLSIIHSSIHVYITIIIYYYEYTLLEVCNYWLLIWLFGMVPVVYGIDQDNCYMYNVYNYSFQWYTKASLVTWDKCGTWQTTTMCSSLLERAPLAKYIKAERNIQDR